MVRGIGLVAAKSRLPPVDWRVMRVTWNGSLSFGLVSIPVGPAPATKPGGRDHAPSARPPRAPPGGPPPCADPPPPPVGRLVPPAAPRGSHADQAEALVP